MFTCTGMLAIPVPPDVVTVPLILTGCPRRYTGRSVKTVIPVAGGCGEVTPVPASGTINGAVVTVLTMFTEPLTGAVARGLKRTSNEVELDGGITSGRAGGFGKLKKSPVVLIELMVTGSSPVLVSVIVFLAGAPRDTLPKASGFGIAPRPSKGSAVALKVIGLPVRPATVAVTVFKPAPEPSVRTAEA